MYNRDGGDGNYYPLLIGGDTSLNPFMDEGQTVDALQDPFNERKGVFANYPAMTPKYAGGNDDRGLETMARLIIPMTNPDARNKFLASFSNGSETRKLAESLTSIGGEAVTGNKQYGLGYIDFLLSSATESYREKVQVVDVLSDNYVAYFFGSAPPIFNYTGVLMNTKQDDWRSAFTIIYNDIIRGTQLARRRAVVTLSYDNMAVTGALVDMNQNLSADNLYQLAATFSFSLLVQRIDIDRVTLSKATEVSSFPSFIKPGAFATKQFAVPPKTIRSTGVPSSQVVERKKDEPELNQPFGSTFSSLEEDDIHGAGRSDLNESKDEILSELNGQSVLPDDF